MKDNQKVNPSKEGKANMLDESGFSIEDTIEVKPLIDDIVENDLNEIKKELNIDGLTGRVDTPKVTTNVVTLKENKNPSLYLYNEFMSNWNVSGAEHASLILSSGLELLEPAN